MPEIVLTVRDIAKLIAGVRLEGPLGHVIRYDRDGDRKMNGHCPVAEDLYGYKAMVVRVVDGDTVVLDIDLGLRTWVRQVSCRLAGLNAPEGKATKAYEFLYAMLPVGKRVWIRTEKDKAGKYGRWLVTIWTDQEDASLNQQLLEGQMAEKW